MTGPTFTNVNDFRAVLVLSWRNQIINVELGCRGFGGLWAGGFHENSTNIPRKFHENSTSQVAGRTPKGEMCQKDMHLTDF